MKPFDKKWYLFNFFHSYIYIYGIKESFHFSQFKKENVFLQVCNETYNRPFFNLSTLIMKDLKESQRCKYWPYYYL